MGIRKAFEVKQFCFFSWKMWSQNKKRNFANRSNIISNWVFIWKCWFSYKSNSFSNEKFWTKTPFWNRGRTETWKSCGLLRTDLRWVAKLASFLTSTHKSQKTQLQGYEFHWLIGCYNNEWTSLNLRWVGLGGETFKNVPQIEWKFWSQPKWVQVNASADKAWSNEVASKPKFSICFMVYLYFSPREKIRKFLRQKQISIPLCKFISICSWQM